MTGMRVGLDIGGTKIHGVLVDAEGTVLAEHRSPTVVGPEGVVQGAVDAVGALRGAVGPGKDADGGNGADDGARPARVVLDGVGIGVPGVVDPTTGSVRYAMNLGLDAEPFALGAAVSQRLDGLRVVVENDLNATALGAAAVLDGVGDDLAYLALGTGVAVGLVLDGRLRRGRHGLAGEVGHLPIDPDGLECPCGQRGCLELYASGSGLARQFPYDGEEPIAAAVHAAALQGDPLAVTVWDRLLDGVAEVTQMLVLSLDVGAVVLGGGIARLGGPLLDGVCSRLVQREGSSAFLADSGLAGRVRLAPPDVPVGAVGAALALGGGH